jgi:hypothetical protein
VDHAGEQLRPRAQQHGIEVTDETLQE